MRTVKAWAVFEPDDSGGESIAVSVSSERLFIFTDEDSAKVLLPNCRTGSVIVPVEIRELPKRKAKR